MSKIELSKVHFTYPGSSEPVLEDFSVTLDTTWKTGLIGRNGRGKTTLLTLLSGKKQPDAGKVVMPCPAAYFPPAVEDTDLTGEELFSTLTLGCPEWKFRRELNLLGVGEDVLYRPFFTLSGGEQTKLLLGALFCQEEGFLLIDEPTNHLDGQGRETVARYLKGKSGFVLVSHDRDFLDGCVDHILALNPTGPELQAGNFSSWWENKQRRDQFELEQNQTLKKEIKKLNQSARQTREWADRAEGAKIGFDPRTTEKSIGRRPAQGAKAKKRMARAKDTLEKTHSFALAGRTAGAAPSGSAVLRNGAGVPPLGSGAVPRGPGGGGWGQRQREKHPVKAAARSKHPKGGLVPVQPRAESFLSAPGLFRAVRFPGGFGRAVGH